MVTTKKIPTDEFRQRKISESKSKVTEAVGSFKGAFNSVLDEAVAPVYEKIEELYKNAVTISDFARAEIVTQKIMAELIDIVDNKLKRLVS
ncbi:MAG: hypothetical protein CVU89_04375 [Firmicutes bacterium HGW-Firmicutes-14]|jgi:hypothetical protein|nr:MAG: hypothetical protein CVU89_04375 [Firmicutes bacterium HGW-Firmicutes-14]